MLKLLGKLAKAEIKSSEPSAVPAKPFGFAEKHLD